jgi:hypothetical protein
MERKREEVTTGTPVMRAAGTLLVAREVKYSALLFFWVCLRLEKNKGGKKRARGGQAAEREGVGERERKLTRVCDSRNHEGKLGNLFVVIGRRQVVVKVNGRTRGEGARDKRKRDVPY